MKAALLVVFVLALGSALPAQETPLAITGARILTMAGPEIADGVLVVHRGRIVQVGPADRETIPAGAVILRVEGVLMPGLVDTHSHIGGPAGGDDSGPIQPECRVLDSIDVRDRGIAKARAGGITTVNVMSGSGHLVSGQTLYLKLREGRTIEDLLFADGGGGWLGGIKFANGTNSHRAPPFPETRAKSAALVRAELLKAREYREKIAAAGGDPAKMPPRDLRLEALVLALDRRIIVHHHTHRHDDISTVLRIAEEFGLKVVLHHVSEGWKVANEIAAAKAPCSVILLDSPGGKLEAADLSRETCGVLERVGASVSIHTDDGITDSRLFLRSAALAVRGGMSREGALRAVTIEAARQLELDSRVGSLEPGKDADFVLLSGDPFSTYTVVRGVWVEGKRLFDRERPEDELIALGGFGASTRQTIHVCCHGDDE